MTDREMEQRLTDAVKRNTPNELDAVLARCGAQNGSVVELKPKQNKKVISRWLAAACAALVLVGGGGAAYHQSYAVTTVVSLDVNPSIELKVNRNEKVIACYPLNEDASLVLADMSGGADLKGTKLDVAVNALVGALLRNGYLDSISSAILISVEDKNADRAARLQQELTSAVDGTLQAQSANAAVLSQTLTQDAGVEQMARENNISAGKAYLVRQVMEMNGTIATNSTTALERLSALSVEELRDLLELRETRIPVGKSAAAYAAEEYAGTLGMNSVTTEVDPELDEVRPHYEVELRSPGLGEFEYLVDAYTGQVYSGKANILSVGAVGTIGDAKARDVALAHIKSIYPELKDITVVSSKMDSEKNRTQYELELRCGNYEFDYSIDAYNGQVLDWEVEIDGVVNGGGGQVDLGQATLTIGEEAAKKAALDHAGVKAAQATITKLKLDRDDGHAVYDVEFYADGVEYEYEIDALDGAVWKYESKRKANVSSGTSTGDVGEKAAKAAALSHAGLTEAQVTRLKVERDYDDGRLEYEVEFKSGGMEYEYTIDGATGVILEHEKDWDD